MRALESTDQRLYSQSMERSGAVDTAMAEFEGGYARTFSANVENERSDRSDLCFHLLTVASQVKFAQQNAEKEEQRLAEVAAWEERYAAWEADTSREGSVWTAVVDSEYRSLMWSQPSQTPTRQPTIQADVSVRDRQRTGSGGGTTSSASVDDLRAFVSCAESCNSLVAEELDDLRTAWRNFRSSCSWVIVETFTLLQSLEQYLEHGELDARWISQIADAFEVAGTGELLNTVLDALAPALDNPVMSDRELLDKLANTDPDDWTQLVQNSPALANQLQLIPPTKINEWWHSTEAKYPPEDKDNETPWEMLPDVFGNLEGVPYGVRSQVNNRVVKEKIADLKSQLADLATEREEALRGAGFSPHQPQSIILSFEAQKRALEEQLDIYKQIHSSAEPEFGQEDRQLITLTAAQPPLAAVAVYAP